MFCDKTNTRDVKQNGVFISDECLKWLHGGYKALLRDYRSINQWSKQKNVFERKKMILRNIIWIHSLSQIEVIKQCCSIHVFRNSFILILYNIIIFTYSNIHCLITLICLIILISHIVKLLLIRKFYCFRPGAHIFFKYARHNHLRCPMMGEVSPET